MKNLKRYLEATKEAREHGVNFTLERCVKDAIKATSGPKWLREFIHTPEYLELAAWIVENQDEFAREYKKFYQIPDSFHTCPYCQEGGI